MLVLPGSMAWWDSKCSPFFILSFCLILFFLLPQIYTCHFLGVDHIVAGGSRNNLCRLIDRRILMVWWLSWGRLWETAVAQWGSRGIVWRSPKFITLWRLKIKETGIVGDGKGLCLRSWRAAVNQRRQYWVRWSNGVAASKMVQKFLNCSLWTSGGPQAPSS